MRWEVWQIASRKNNLKEVKRLVYLKLVKIHPGGYTYGKLLRKIPKCFRKCVKDAIKQLIKQDVLICKNRSYRVARKLKKE